MLINGIEKRENTMNIWSSEREGDENKRINMNKIN